MSIELGENTDYASNYDASILYPIPRSINRAELNLTADNLPFDGVDIWNHYEVSWLNQKGKPQVAIAQIIVPATSEFIIESKSMKLYFNGFNNFKFTTKKELSSIIANDLSSRVKDNVSVNLYDLDSQEYNVTKLDGINIDDVDVTIDEYMTNVNLLKSEDEIVSEKIYSNLFKSNCLVTNQPDWASVSIEYTGNKINHESLLKYIISFRNHNEFHEQCVERIFCDIMTKVKLEKLTVIARFTRRGGIDINPIRTNQNITYTNERLIRQ